MNKMHYFFYEEYYLCKLKCTDDIGLSLYCLSVSPSEHTKYVYIRQMSRNLKEEGPTLGHFYTWGTF